MTSPEQRNAMREQVQDLSRKAREAMTQQDSGPQEADCGVCGDRVEFFWPAGHWVHHDLHTRDHDAVPAAQPTPASEPTCGEQEPHEAHIWYGPFEGRCPGVPASESPEGVTVAELAFGYFGGPGEWRDSEENPDEDKPPYAPWRDNPPYADYVTAAFVNNLEMDNDALTRRNERLGAGLREQLALKEPYRTVKQLQDIARRTLEEKP